MMKEEKELKRFWNAIVSKWVGVKKNDDLTCIKNYNLQGHDIFELEMVVDCNP